MVTATVPADQVAAIAARDDVAYVVPNRATQRTASTLESITGALASNVRSYSSISSYTGYDGSGIGIAVLDSGVMRTHEAFLDSSNASRVARNVQVISTSQANWGVRTDGSISLQPGSSALASCESSIDNGSTTTVDGYGHGTHVASIAAGRAATYNYAPNTSGLAPNAKIYDVKVLNNWGFGTLSDTLEGLQWAMYHAKEYNIRVINLSLAAASTDSWQTDPLCIAARNATAMGITVVVAAGNFGKNIFTGQEIYGSISAPGNDRSVITVGSANFKDTRARSDDVVNNFS